MRGAARMVEANGGLEALGLDGFLALLFHKFVDEVGYMSNPSDQIPAGSCAEAFRTHSVSSCT